MVTVTVLDSVMVVVLSPGLAGPPVGTVWKVVGILVKVTDPVTVTMPPPLGVGTGAGPAPF